VGAAEAGIRIAKLLDARLRVVQVEPTQALLTRLGLGGIQPKRVEPKLTDSDVIRLAYREGLRPSTFETDTLRGQPRQTLLEEAQRWQADLIVLGANERQPPGVRLGTITEHLIRHASCPVLIIEGNGALPPRKTLFPVDLSEFAGYAMACGLNFLEQIGSSDTPDHENETLLVVPSQEDTGNKGQKDLERVSREQLANWLDDADFPALTRSIAAGSPGRAIVDHAKAGGADLIVMGTHGHDSHGLPLRGIGSVTGEVLGEAPCHMLIVPPVAELGAEIAEAVVSQTEPRFSKRLFL
jgi:nucleotide-binding universal stress UspA family protein